MQIYTQRKVNVTKPENSLLFGAIFDLEQAISAACLDKDIPDDSVIRIEVEGFSYSESSVFNSRILVRFVCPGVGSSAARIFYSRDTNRGGDPIFLIMGNGYKLATPHDIFQTVFEQAIERLGSKKAVTV